MSNVKEEIKIGKNKLYNSDCITIMKEKVSKGEKYDIVLTDPPYGIDLTPQRNTSKFKNTKVLNDNTTDTISKFLPLSAQLSDTIYMFCSWKNYAEIQPIFEKSYKLINLLVWDKMWLGMGGNWRPNHEFILYGVKKGSGSFSACNKENILRHKRVAPVKLTHSCEKPTDLLKEILEQYDYESVLDPFMGTGATGEAAISLNYRFTGIELDSKYFKVAKNRIEAARNAK